MAAGEPISKIVLFKQYLNTTSEPEPVRPAGPGRYKVQEPSLRKLGSMLAIHLHRSVNRYPPSYVRLLWNFF